MDIAAPSIPRRFISFLNDPENSRSSNKITNTTFSSPQKLLHKYVARKSRWCARIRTQTRQARRDQATLLPITTPRLENRQRHVTGMFAESYRFPEVPANLYDVRLLMSLETPARENSNRASYLRAICPGTPITFFTVTPTQRTDLDAGSPSVNNSGTAFHNAVSN